MLKRATLKDVAGEAGVSPAAISRFLSGSLELPEPTASRIRNAVATLRYVPNASARRLSTGVTDMIALVASDIANPFFALLTAAVEEAAAKVGLDVVVWGTRNTPARELACLDRLRAGHVDGLLFMTNHKDEGPLAEALSGARNAVLLDEDVPGTRLSKLFVDNEYGAHAATRYLIELGHRRIAHIGGPPGLMSAVQRANGWRRALSEAGVVDHAALHLAGDYDIAFGRDALRRLLDRPDPPSAIFVGSDYVAIGLLEVLNQRGLSCPEDLSIVGFDGLPIGALLNPPLTTVRQPIELIAQAGLDELRRRMHHPNGRPRTTILPVRLEIRASAQPLVRRPRCRTQSTASR